MAECALLRPIAHFRALLRESQDPLLTNAGEKKNYNLVGHFLDMNKRSSLQKQIEQNNSSLTNLNFGTMLVAFIASPFGRSRA